MNKLFRTLSVTCVAALLATSLFGCGGSTTSSSSTGAAQETTKAATESSAAAGKAITMRFSWWGPDARHKATLDAIAAYKAKNPNVTIEGEYGGYDGYQQKLMTQLAGGSAADIIQIDPIWNAQLGQQKDSFVDFTNEKTVDLTQFEDKVLKGFCTANGIIIGLPAGINGFGVMMNTSFMKKYNVPTDKAWTWQDLVTEGKKLHDSDKNAYLLMLDQGILQGYFLPDYIRNKTGNFWVTDDYAIKASKEDLTEAFTVMKSFFDSGAAAPFGETSIINTKLETYQRFINNQIGMTEDMSGAIAKYKGVVKPENFGVAAAVTVKDGKDTTTLYKPSMLFAVNAKSANKDEAVKFTNWMLNDKDAAGILKDCRSTPASAASRQVLKDANALDKDVTQMVEATLKNPAQPMPLVINNAEIADITKDVISKVIFNKLTPDKGADELISRVTSKLNELKTKK